MTSLFKEGDPRRRLYASYVSRSRQRQGPEMGERDYQDWARATRARVSGWLPADRGTPILDMGCGPGYFLYLLENLGYKDVTGVDIGPEQISLARRRCPRSRIIESDARETLAQNPGHFGLITAFDFIEHFKKEELLPLLTLVAQGLRAGGRVIIQTPNAGSPRVGEIAYGDLTHEWFFTPQSLKDLLGQVGLRQFAAKPCTPYVHGLTSFVRALLWQLLQLKATLEHLIETGNPGSGIYTRVFLGTAVKE
jgi:2-polyprenyl-3-methyl-5-hydroxy-6-metoxy-1,4-benzoquinol methylase